MINEISLKNFRSHEETTIKPGRVTALVGPNGCGKTSLLKAVHYLTQSLQRIGAGFSWDSYFQDDRDPSTIVRRSQNPFSFSVSARGLEAAVEWMARIEFVRMEDASEISKGWRSNEDFVYGTLRNTPEASEKARKALGQSFYFKGIAHNIARPSYSTQILPKLESDGSGLASVIAYLMTNEREQINEIERSLSAIVPIARQIRVKPAKLTQQEKKVLTINGNQLPYEEQREIIGHQLLIDTTGAKEITADSISEGTLLVLALLTVLWGPSRPNLILLDDIEQGLHPVAQRETMQLLRKFAEQHQRQIIVTSHSPYVVDELEAEDVWVMATDADGVSRVSQLSKHADAERALSVLTTGEFLGAAGETWVTEAGLSTE